MFHPVTICLGNCDKNPASPARNAVRSKDGGWRYFHAPCQAFNGDLTALPASFDGNFTTLPDFNRNAQKLPSSQITNLPTAFTNELLAYAAARDPYINSILTHQHDLQTARERDNERDFKNYLQKTQEMVNTKYPHFSNKMADDMITEIGKMFQAIYQTAMGTGPPTGLGGGESSCSYKARKNAVVTMVDNWVTVYKGPNAAIARRMRNVPQNAVIFMLQSLDHAISHHFKEHELALLDISGLLHGRIDEINRSGVHG
ncbi:hypothetical protein QBC32DRAFT_388098 [Pseudoneurospora amorphoporcata]|uniref:Uncharacterized protein n=1 Tax=Pseudoneurospora amorphoporcata TaxID=241081 RepID=A0AAN6NL25_9PEZI|nr:hypothetical protein QBC32DRAFT_388098 [Pseudoneurospora amorphoporcata]